MFIVCALFSIGCLMNNFTDQEKNIMIAMGIESLMIRTAPCPVIPVNEKRKTVYVDITMLDAFPSATKARISLEVESASGKSRISTFNYAATALSAIAQELSKRETNNAK